jgi:translation initiation factor IF-3
MMTPPVKSGPRYNQMIAVDKVRVIDENGENLGVMYTREAIEQAAEVGLDLVEVSPNADPPVCKILDFGKWKYQEEKKKNAARKKQRVIEVKEIKLRPGIDDHDFEIKMRAMTRFLEEGDKVKVTLRFRGREMVHQELGARVLDRVKEVILLNPYLQEFQRDKPSILDIKAEGHDGKKINIPLAQLSDADQKWVREWTKKTPSIQPRPTKRANAQAQR